MIRLYTMTLTRVSAVFIGHTLRVEHATQLAVAVEPTDERLVRGLRAHKARDGCVAAEPVDVECAHLGGEGAGVGARQDLRVAS